MLGRVPRVGPAVTAAITGGGGAARTALMFLGAATVLGGAAFVGYRALHHDRAGDPSSPSAPSGDAKIGPTELGTIAPRSTPPRTGASTPIAPTPTASTPVASAPITTVPGAEYLQLTKTGPRAATSATDPAAFQQLLAADGPGWAAADGTISIPLPDGQALWLFGDTIVNLPKADGSLRRNADFVRNSAILHDGATATTVMHGTARDADDFLKPANPDEWYWPGHGIAQGDELMVFMGRVHKTADGAQGWNFEGLGTDLVRLDLHDLSVKERIAMPGGKGTEWGTAVIEDKQHTYVYGFQGGDGFDRHAVVARAPKGELGDAPFEYWDGKRWQADAANAAHVADGPSNSFSVVRTPEGKFAMVSQELFFGTGLQVRTSDAPQGPWSERRTIDPGPPKPANGISYNAQAHPTFTEDGKLLASWNMNRSDGQLPGPNQLDGYRPVFRSVDANLLDE